MNKLFLTFLLTFLLISNRPYVDWNKIEELLIKENIIQPNKNKDEIPNLIKNMKFNINYY